MNNNNNNNNIMWIIDGQYIARTEEEKEEILIIYRQAYDIPSWDLDSNYVDIIEVNVSNQIEYMKKNLNID